MFPIRDHNPSHKLPIITVLIIIVTSFVFFLELSALDLESFIETYALVPSFVNFLDLKTLLPFISSIFLHGGWLHIISNMWFFWIFGDNIEAALGRITFILFYLICGIAAGLLQYLVNPSSSVPMLGASGAVAGILGAYLVLYPRHRIDTLVATFGGFMREVQMPASLMLGYWFVIQLFSGVGSLGVTSGGGIAFWAHVGGFVAGWIVVRFFKSKINRYG